MHEAWSRIRISLQEYRQAKHFASGENISLHLVEFGRPKDTVEERRGSNSIDTKYWWSKRKSWPDMSALQPAYAHSATPALVLTHNTSQWTRVPCVCVCVRVCVRVMHCVYRQPGAQARRPSRGFPMYIFYAHCTVNPGWDKTWIMIMGEGGG